VSLAVVIVTLAVAKAGPKEVKIFQPMYDKFVHAFMKSDWKSVEGLVAPGYEAKGPEGKTVTWPQIVAEFTQQRKAMETVKWPRTVKSVSISGSNAKVIVEGHLTATMKGQDGKPHTLQFDATTSDTWIKISGTWKIKKGEIVKQQMLFDGKPRDRR